MGACQKCESGAPDRSTIPQAYGRPPVRNLWLAIGPTPRGRRPFLASREGGPPPCMSRRMRRPATTRTCRDASGPPFRFRHHVDAWTAPLHGHPDDRRSCRVADCRWGHVRFSRGMEGTRQRMGRLCRFPARQASVGPGRWRKEGTDALQRGVSLARDGATCQRTS